MPVLRCPGKKKRWRIGKGPCSFKSKKKAESAYKGYLGKKHSKKGAKK